MKCLLAAVALVGAGVIVAFAAPADAQYAPKWMVEPATVCVERPEEHGRSNVDPVTVVVGSLPLVLLGGTAACAFVAAPDLRGEIVVELRYPDDPFDRAAVANPPLRSRHRMPVSPRATISLELCGGYGAWDLVRAGRAGPRGCTIDGRRAGEPR